jgi:hypothetical protein
MLTPADLSSSCCARIEQKLATLGYWSLESRGHERLSHVTSRMTCLREWARIKRLLRSYLSIAEKEVHESSFALRTQNTIM